MADDYDDDEYELPQRRAIWPAVVAAILIVAVAGTFGFNALVDVAPDVLRPAGDQRSYAFLQVDPNTQEPARYNPCEPIRYVIDRRLAPEGTIADLRRGLEIVTEVSGIEFRFEGYAQEENLNNRPPYQPGRYRKADWAPVLFTWVPSDRLLTPSDAAVGSAGSTYARNERGELVYLTGIVTFNYTARLLNGYELGDSWGDVVLHEIGHLLGLAHVNDTTQVMHPNVTGGEARFGAGDIAGLRSLARGCLEVPKPG